MSYHVFLWVSLLWGSLSFLNLYIYDLSKFVKISTIISLSSFPTLPFFFSFWDFSDSNTSSFVKSHSPWDCFVFVLFCFSNLFSLVFKLSNFYFPIFQFTDFFLMCFFHSSVEIIHWEFYFKYKHQNFGDWNLSAELLVLKIYLWADYEDDVTWNQLESKQIICNTVQCPCKKPFQIKYKFLSPYHSFLMDKHDWNQIRLIINSWINTWVHWSRHHW